MPDLAQRPYNAGLVKQVFIIAIVIVIMGYLQSK